MPTSIGKDAIEFNFLSLLRFEEEARSSLMFAFINDIFII